jgi:hypothetical protein
MPMAPQLQCQQADTPEPLDGRDTSRKHSARFGDPITKSVDRRPRSPLSRHRGTHDRHHLESPSHRELKELRGKLSTAKTQGGVARDTAFRLEDKVDKLALVCQAMFELLHETSGISEEQLKKKIVEIDGRDGQADGRITPRARKCPKCEATMSPQFGRCLFCGHTDEAAPVIT